MCALVCECVHPVRSDCEIVCVIVRACVCDVRAHPLHLFLTPLHVCCTSFLVRNSVCDRTLLHLASLVLSGRVCAHAAP